MKMKRINRFFICAAVGLLLLTAAACRADPASAGSDGMSVSASAENPVGTVPDISRKLTELYPDSAVFPDLLNPLKAWVIGGGLIEYLNIPGAEQTRTVMPEEISDLTVTDAPGYSLISLKLRSGDTLTLYLSPQDAGSSAALLRELMKK